MLFSNHPNILRYSAFMAKGSFPARHPRVRIHKVVPEMAGWRQSRAKLKEWLLAVQPFTRR